MPRKLWLASGALLAALAATWFISPRARSVLNLTYVVRFITYPKVAPVTSVGWYAPQEKVEGGNGSMMWQTPRSHPLDAETRARLEEFAKASASAALLVVREARRGSEPEVLFSHSAFPPTTDERPGRQALTDSNSMAKTPVGLLVGVALAQGKIGSLDDRASRYVPEWRGDAREEITIRELLTMSSGLRNLNSRTFPLSDLAVMHLGKWLEPFVLSIPGSEPHGKRYEYNNANSQILALILERVYGRRYASLLSEYLWKPVAAQDAFLWLDHEAGLARAYCCLLANPYDWARLGLLFLADGRVNDRQVIPADWIREMRKPSPLSPAFGSHLWIGTPEKAFEPKGLYMISGLGEQHVFILPEERLVIVRVGEKARAWNWEENFLPNLLARSMAKARPPSSRASPVKPRKRME